MPTFEAFMLPVLICLSHGEILRRRDLMQRVAAAMHLTEEQLAMVLPAGGPTWANRCGWAVTFLHRAGLIEKVARGTYRLSERGTQLLATNPAAVDQELLMQYQEFREFINGNATGADAAPAAAQVVVPVQAQTPEERLNAAYREMHSALRAELLELVLRSDPSYFEQIVLDLLVAMGYGGEIDGAAVVEGGPGDGGIDGTVRQDRLGLDMVYVQAKRWGPQHTVGAPEVQAFIGAIAGRRAAKGVLFTTSTFTRAALQAVQHVAMRVVLIDGNALADLMIEHGIGVSSRRKIVISRIDSDYFED